MSSPEIHFHPAAIDEAEDAARWYRERSPRTAKRFVDELRQVLEKIREAPRRWPRHTDRTRKLKLPCFPFAVIYSEMEGQINILAVAHGKRRPGYWKKRV